MQVPVEPAVRKFVAQSFLYRDGVDTLPEGQSLLEAGLIDSTGILELVCFLEKTFQIRIADEEVIPDNLDSIRQIIAYVQRKTTEAPSTDDRLCV